MKALCQEYRNGARRNEQRNGENDTYRFQRRHNGQRDHAQQPIMQPSRMQTAYLRLLIIKAEQQKIPPFYANNKCNQPGNNHRLDYIADGYPEHVAEKNMVKMYVWFDCNIQNQTCGKHARKNNPHHCILLDSAVVFQVSRRHRAEYSGDECPCSQR